MHDQREQGDGGLDVLVLGMHFPPEHTGNAPYTAGMVDGLAAAGHHVRVITGYPHYPEWAVHPGFTGLRRREHRGTVPVTRVRHPVPTMPTARARAGMDAAFAAHAAAIGRQGARRPDVVVAVSPVLLTVLAGMRWRRPGRTALGVVTQDLYSRAVAETGIAPPGIGKVVADLERRLLTRVDGVAVVHETFEQRLVDLGVKPDRITVVPNWSHLPQVPRPRTDRESVRRRLGWGRDEIIALHAGNMGLKQGLENVVEAARRADGRGAPVRFVLLGQGGRRATLRTVAAGVRRLQFLDPLPDEAFPGALDAADVLVVNEAPTVAEMSAPSKLTSYFGAGRPVVGACWERSAAAVELDRSGGGVRVDPGEPDALLDAVLALAADPRRAEALASSGRAYARLHLGVAGAHRAYRDWVALLAASRDATVAPVAPWVPAPRRAPTSAPTEAVRD